MGASSVTDAPGTWPVALVMLTACASPRELAAKLQNAASPDAFPGVTQCWDGAYEAMGRRGGYDLVTDFQIARDGTIGKVLVDRILDAESGEPADDTSRLASCIEEALDGSSLAGAGFTPPRPVAVTGYRFALRDAQGGFGRRDTDEPRLIGPRADRCRGLFAYDPPRDAPVLDRALDEATAEAQAAAGPDRRARALQRAYDISLELTARLSIERVRDDLPEASRDKIDEERRRVDETRHDLAARIGCPAQS